jgi:hypothetical protein
LLDESPAWSWIGASSVGTSHVNAGEPCEDHAAVVVAGTSKGSVLIAAVSDGAGSAQYANLGSRLVVRGFVNAVRTFLRQDGSLDAITDEIAYAWIDAVRDRIGDVARKSSATPRDFAATLVALLVGPEQAVVFHVGDGGCVIRQNQDDWLVASWPAHGEYAATTFFVTDDPAPTLRVTRLCGRYTDIAVFSDGIERLVLDFSSMKAFSPFFDRMFRPLAASKPGRDRGLSRSLHEYLSSKAVTDRTDDDKTLIMAKRMASSV